MSDAAATPSTAATGALLRDYLVLTKPRITLMVLLTALGGWWAALREWGDPLTLVAMLAGTTLTAAGASALNMVLERFTDGLMDRTRRRPLPAGRMQPGEARVFGWAISALGMLTLLLFCGWLAALVALATWASYLYLYTPLKLRSHLSTVVGAVPGALPPLIGWAAARAQLDWLGWALFAIIFLWQLPHFLAIAVIYREDYARGGFPMLPVVDGTGGDAPGDGRATVLQMIGTSFALLPVSLLPWIERAAGPLYFVGALLAGLAMIGGALAYALRPGLPAARRLFYISLLYLPLVFILLMADGRTPPPALQILEIG